MCTPPFESIVPQYAFTRESWVADEPDADDSGADEAASEDAGADALSNADALAEPDDAAVLDDPADPPHAASPRQHAHIIATIDNAISLFMITPFSCLLPFAREALHLIAAVSPPLHLCSDVSSTTVAASTVTCVLLAFFMAERER